MNIVIVGAGDIGLHLATVFSHLQYGIVLIDQNPHKLELVERDLDIAIRRGSGTDWELLEELLEISPDLLVAVTQDDSTNLVASTIGKNLGYRQTIARVRSSKYFLQSRLHFERLFGVDYLIGPEKLTASALLNMILLPGAIAIESFSQGSVQMRTVQLPHFWDKSDILLKDREKLHLPKEMMVALIRRKIDGKEVVIFPHGNDTLLPLDEVTFIGETQGIEKLNNFIGTPSKLPTSVTILGGSLVGIELALMLHEWGIKSSIVDKDPEKCRLLSEKFPFVTIIEHNAIDYRFMTNEKIGMSEVVVVATRNDETNFLLAAMLKDLGCEKIIISLSDTNLNPLTSRLGVSHVVSPRINAANRILSIARGKKVVSMVSLYDNKAEVMEVKISSDSKIAGIPIQRLGPELPNDFLIAIIQSRGRIFVADGSRILSPGDTVVLITNPLHSEEIKKLF
jgi:trk system potassium uptake protein TrkA